MLMMFTDVYRCLKEGTGSHTVGLIGLVLVLSSTQRRKTVNREMKNPGVKEGIPEKDNVCTSPKKE